MRVKSIFCGSGLVLLLSVLTAAAGTDNARLPYHILYTAQKTRAELNQAHTNLLVVLTMQSTQPEVKSSDLAIYIDAKSGKVPVEIGTAGDFNVPMRDDLLAEDPWVVVNQPKGTMKLDWKVGLIPGRITNSIHYVRLMRPLRESEDVQEKIRLSFGNGPRRTVTGLKLTFPSTPQRAVAVIHAKGGDRKLEANENGEVVLPLASELLDEDPEITLSTIPGAVEIVSHERAD